MEGGRGKAAFELDRVEKRGGSHVKRVVTVLCTLCCHTLVALPSVAPTANAMDGVRTETRVDRGTRCAF